METLVLGSKGRCPVTFTLHLRAPDPEGRARGPVIGDSYRAASECTSWVTLELYGGRDPLVGGEERVRLEPESKLLPENGPAMRRCAARALAFLPSEYLCDPQDREGLGEDDPHHLMAFLEPADVETLIAVLVYFALGYGADYPFMGIDPSRSSVRALVEGLSVFPSRLPPV